MPDREDSCEKRWWIPDYHDIGLLLFFYGLISRVIPLGEVEFDLPLIHRIGDSFSDSLPLRLSVLLRTVLMGWPWLAGLLVCAIGVRLKTGYVKNYCLLTLAFNLIALLVISWCDFNLSMAIANYRPPLGP